MENKWLMIVWLCLLSNQTYAIDTYFPGAGPPTSADVETQPPQYYIQQTPQPDTDDTQYNNPAAPINPNEIMPTPTDPLEGADN